MKNLKKIFLISFLLILLAYATNITAIPSKITLFKGEELKLKTLFGIYVNQNLETVETVSNMNNKNILEKKKISLKLFNIINLKKIEVNTIPKAKVIPLGNTVGLKLYTSGVLVVGLTEIDGKKPYENTGIEEGDIIVEINENEIETTEELIKNVNNSKGENINIKYIREGQEHIVTMAPIKTNNNEYKLGLWVRDGAAGIGTVTYYEQETQQFAALGHGIMDIDTGKLINISSGELITARISDIIKGKEGIPGEIKGSIVNREKDRDYWNKYRIWYIWKNYEYT